MRKRKKTPFIDSLGKAIAEKAGEDLDRQAREILMSVYGAPDPLDLAHQNHRIDFKPRKYPNEKA